MAVVDDILDSQAFIYLAPDKPALPQKVGLSTRARTSLIFTDSERGDLVEI